MVPLETKAHIKYSLFYTLDSPLKLST